MSAKIAYRRDIDGLRTIAVGAVIIFHAFPTLVPGGFVGVDVFFVISGFLITGILVREHEQTGRIDLFEFYARRVRRLLPALLTVVGATLALAGWLAPASGELQSIAKSAIAALFFSSNIFFALQPSGYFAQAAETYPLLHTWTLAVEEQFYIVWPLLIPLAVWIGGRVGLTRQSALWTLFGAVFVVSFVIGVVVTTVRPVWAFYLTPFRAWEFAIGALLSLALHGDHPRSSRGGAILAVVGLVLIGLSLWLLGRSTPFPGWAALLPTTGAAALLAAGAITPGNFVTRSLSIRPAVYIGKLSYGWYLWHWPLLAFARSDALGEASHGTIAVAIVVSFLLSAASYRLIETPVHLQRPRLFRTTRTSLIAGVGLLLTGATIAGATIVIAERTLRSSPRLQAITVAESADGEPEVASGCWNYAANFRALTAPGPCTLGDRTAQKTVILIGDSHAARLLAMLDVWGRTAHVAILARTRGGCRPLEGITSLFGEPGKPYNDQDLAACARFRAAALAEASDLAATGRVAGIVIVSHWPNATVEAVKTADRKAFDAGFNDGLDRLVSFARDRNLRLVLMQDTPLFEYHVPRCLARRADRACAEQRADAQMDRAAVRSMLAARAGDGVTTLDPSHALCTGGYCPPIRNGVVTYIDAHHLSWHASAALAAPLAPALDAAILAK